MTRVWPWLLVAIAGAWGMVHVAATVSNHRRRQRGPALLAQAQAHIEAQQWSAAARALRAALPFGVARRDVGRARDIIRLARRIDRGQLRPRFLKAHTLEAELDRVEREGGSAAGVGALEWFLERTAAGAHDRTARDQAPPLLRAVLARDPATVDALLAGGADVTARDAHGTSVIRHALDDGNPAILRRVVPAHGALDPDELRALLHVLVVRQPAEVDDDVRWLAGWLADQPAFDVSEEDHVTQQTLGAWAEDVGAPEVTARLAARGTPRA